MPLSNASRLADFGTGIGTAGAIIQVDNANQRLGVGTTAPTATLGVAGIVSATAFYGDGSNLDGVASAGLGTALSEVEFDPLTVIYQTSDTLSVGATITVDPPDATTKVAYTQYAEILLQDDADLIVADGDDFIPDILGLSTEGFSFSNANGNGIFDTVYTDNIENAAGRGAPNFPLGITVTGISTLSGNVSIGGTLTYEDVTNIDSVGMVTARTGIEVLAGGINAVGVVTGTSFKGDGSLLTGIDATSLKDSSDNIIAQATSTGIGIGTVTPANLLEIQGANGAGGLRLTETNHTNLNRHGRIFEYAGGLYFQSRNDTANGDFIFRGGLDSVEKLRIGSSSQIGIGGANYGTSGQVLTSGGASAAVQWADAASAVDILATANLGSDYGQNYFDYTGITNTSGYIRYAMMFSGVQFVDGSSQTFGFRFYRGSSGQLETGGIYECTTSKKSYGYNSITNESNSPGNAFLLLGNSNNSRQLWSGKLEWANVFNPSTKNAPPFARCFVDQGGNSWHSIGWDACRFTTTNTEWISGVRLMNYGSGSNLKNGRITVYGYRY